MGVLKTLKKAALIAGICLLVFFIFNRIIPIYLKTDTQILRGEVANFIIYGIIRIISTILCLEIAERLNRNKIFWGIFGFILPPIALIIIAVISPKTQRITVQNPANSETNDLNSSHEGL
jgi:hypothetical protein